MSKLKMDTVTQIGTPISKHKVEQDSLLSNYLNSLNLTPIQTVQSIPTFDSLSFASPPGFKSCYCYYSDPFKVGSGSTGEEALLETKPPQILKKDCTGCREDGETDLQKMCDRNVKQKSDTPDWETMISDPVVLIDGSPCDKEAYRCFLLRSTDSKTRSCGRTKPRLEPVSNSNKPESSDALSVLHRGGVTRRCLDFEMMENCKQTLGESSSGCVAPSIGLHLNAVAMSSKDNNVGSEYSFSGNVKAEFQRSNAPVHDFVRENAGQIVEEVPKSLALVDMNQRSPKKKKRRKSEQAGEGESSCKRCNCKKSKCLKLYCECFAAGVYCIEPCSCIDCFNKPIYKDTVLDTRKQIESRNPQAFAPKVIRNADSIMQAGDDARKTPALARHKRGCNCRKSNCLKKYCECYQSGVGCSINCRCEGCKNTFGRKFASLFIGMDIKQDDENETYGKSVTAKPQQKAELCSSVPLSPSTTIRQPLAQLPISSNNMMLPQHGASGSSSYNSQSFSKQDMSLLSHSRIETITEHIENLIQSPIANINAVSPNSKKVSPPQYLNSTPCRRNGGRKLLRSIPSFPSLTPHH